MSTRNYAVTPLNDFINGYEADGGNWCGSNGQCTLIKCQEWIDRKSCYPELVRDERTGFAICPKCGCSYGKAAMTGIEYRKAVENV